MEVVATGDETTLAESKEARQKSELAAAHAALAERVAAINPACAVRVVADFVTAANADALVAAVSAGDEMFEATMTRRGSVDRLERALVERDIETVEAKRFSPSTSRASRSREASCTLTGSGVIVA